MGVWEGHYNFPCFLFFFLLFFLSDTLHKNGVGWLADLDECGIHYERDSPMALCGPPSNFLRYLSSILTSMVG